MAFQWTKHVADTSISCAMPCHMFKWFKKIKINFKMKIKKLSELLHIFFSSRVPKASSSHLLHFLVRWGRKTQRRKEILQILKRCVCFSICFCIYPIYSFSLKTAQPSKETVIKPFPSLFWGLDNERRECCSYSCKQAQR